MAEFLIGELAKLTEVSIQTLRYYDRIGLFQPQRVDERSGYRYYGTSQMFKLEVIKYLRHLGIGIPRIREFFAANRTDQQQFLKQREHQVTAEITELQGIQALLRGQQQQLQLKQDLAQRPVGQVYCRKLPVEMIATLTPSAPLTPADRPDVAFSELAKRVKLSGTVANLQYGCAYPLRDYERLSAIHYQMIFTQIFEPTANLPAENQQVLPAGTYLCTAFRWSHATYLAQLDVLKQAYRKQVGVTVPATVLEVSLLDGYDYATDASFLTELRILLPNRGESCGHVF